MRSVALGSLLWWDARRTPNPVKAWHDAYHALVATGEESIVCMTHRDGRLHEMMVDRLQMVCSLRRMMDVLSGQAEEEVLRWLRQERQADTDAILKGAEEKLRAFNLCCLGLSSCNPGGLVKLSKLWHRPRTYVRHRLNGAWRLAMACGVDDEMWAALRI